MGYGQLLPNPTTEALPTILELRRVGTQERFVDESGSPKVRCSL
jgi:hypothetical protein